MLNLMKERHRLWDVLFSSCCGIITETAECVADRNPVIFQKASADAEIN